MKENELTLTEQRNPHSEDVDVKSSLEIVEIINREDEKVSRAVFDARATIATAIDWVAEAFLKDGRLIYAGAGTSGRLGVLDASECPPTFGVPRTQVQAIIAGGKTALTRAVEGAEDDVEAGERDLLKLIPTKNDVILGISSGSTTPYVRAALKAAQQIGAKSILLTCTPLRDRADFADLVIIVLTGPEILTGSTRMKAGSATKMVLNTITTGAMIRTGRTYGNLMVDLSCSNRKLVSRGLRIIQSVTRLPEIRAKTLLCEAYGHVKLALAMGVLGVSRRDGERLLHENKGFLRRLFDQPHTRNPRIEAVFFDMDGTIVQYGLPTGFSTWAALGWAYEIFNQMEDWVGQYLAKEISYDAIWEACAKTLNGQSFVKALGILFPCSGMPPYSRGFVDCVRALKPHYRLGIVSSGLSMVSEEIHKSLNLDFELSNHLGIHQGHFDGTYSVRVPFDKKLEALTKQAGKIGVPLSKICFVGDSPNDIEVLRSVGLPVAYNPKTELVSEAARGNVIGDFLQLPKLIERAASC
jgi:N-acetylmuramic acid 6-phosphate etherase